MNYCLQLAKIIIIIIMVQLLPIGSTIENVSDTIWILKCCDFNQIIQAKEKDCGFDNTIGNLTVSVYENDHVTRDNLINVGFAFYPITCVDFGSDYYLKLQPDVYPDQEFFVQNDGYLWVSQINTSVANHQFCLEYSEGFGISAYVCFPGFNVVPEIDEVSTEFIAIGMIISLPFLLATFIIYALLPERNLHGMCLMCYVFALFGGYSILSFCYIYSHFSIVSFLACRIIGILVYFFLELSFFWMNVIAYDIWLTFSGNKKKKNPKNKKQRFLTYSMYAWCMPLLFLILVITLSNTVSPTAWYNPGIREHECWIREGIPKLIYWYGPLAILTILNIIFFGLTALKIKQTRKQTAILRQKENKCENEVKQSFNLYLKLLFAMGVNWSIEILPIICDLIYFEMPNAVWYLGQFCNAAHGVSIFLIFVCKKNIWKSLKKRKLFTKMKTTTIETPI